jgi:hypothetical protein
MNKFKLLAGASMAAMLAMSGMTGALADGDGTADGEAGRIEALEARIQQLEATNQLLLDYLARQGVDVAQSGAPAAAAAPAAPHTPHSAHTAAHTAAPAAASSAPAPHTSVRPAHLAHHASPSEPHATHHAAHSAGLVGISPEYGYRVLDHAEGVNTRQLMTLQAIQAGELPHRVTLSGGVTVLGNVQRSNSDTKFGWLMRHPTSANQIGEDVSELVVHSAQLAFTARVSDFVTAYGELLYNPEQSFGSGTITTLTRNQVEMRKAYVLIGNLDRTPLYGAIGKMDVPFGLQDTVSPFTNSTSWHAFAPLAYGGMVGWWNGNLHLRAMAVQGGAQFRSANVPVQDTAVPSRVNNFALDANYTLPLGQHGDQVMVGASYIHGSAYCQPYPVVHFNPCQENNPAWAAYTLAHLGNFTLLGEYARTTEIWPGSAVPDPTNPLSAFDAQETSAFTLGGRYAWPMAEGAPVDISFEFSRFRAGEDGAPWERQDQYVAGLSRFIAPSVSLFGEYIHTDGWVPLNFLSGGNFTDGSTWSERDATTDILAVGIQAAF